MKETVWIRFKKIIFGAECSQYGIRLWQCPGVLFLAIGIITITSTLVTFFVASKKSGPEVVIPLLFGVVLAVFIPGALLVRSFERLMLADRVKSEFVSITSHQLRSPMSAVKWLVDLLITNRLGKLEGEQKDYVHLIRENNDRMIELVNNLLDVARIEKGDLRIQKDNIDLVYIVRGIMDTNQKKAEEKKIKLEVSAFSDTAKVLGDEIHLGAVFANLIDNAIKYSNEGGTVFIKIINEGKMIKCQVQDKGVGIPKYEQKYIFSKFFTGDNHFNYRKGPGLGLFIAKAAIKAMGGKIGFASKEGEGSTFWFTVPTAK